MAWRSVFNVGLDFLKKIRQYPTLLHRFPKSFKLPRVLIQPRCINQGRSLFGNIFGFYQDSIAGALRKTIINSSTRQRPNSLLRAYHSLAGSVQLRHDFKKRRNFTFKTINEASKRNSFKFGSLSGWFSSYPTSPTISNSSSLAPGELIASGCNSAVWSAKFGATSEFTNQDYDERMNQLAVKVLYNYYASTDPSTSSLPNVCRTNTDESLKSDILPPDWILLHRQIQRECDLRPQTDHPNIVPLIGHFIDRAPLGNCSSNPEVQNSNDDTCSESPDRSHIQRPINSNLKSQSSVMFKKQNIWAGAESFPEGFGGQPLTAYLIMPRFEGTLDDLLKGLWPPHYSTEIQQSTDLNALPDVVRSVNHSDSLSRGFASEQSDPHISSLSEHNSMPLAVDDAVAILAQLFDAVSELEAHGIAHRDIKPNNILLRENSASILKQQLSIDSVKNVLCNQNTPEYIKSRQMDWLNDSEASKSNSRFHVAITDFGCAIRTRDRKSSLPYLDRLLTHLNAEIDPNVEILNHSGNTVLLAPEIASRDSTPLRPHDYEKADLWAVATLAYPLFGLPNPFISGRLSSKTYSENELPNLPEQTPGVVKWLISECLNRKPDFRPAASLVADVLHVWCLIRRLNRHIQQNSTTETSTDKETASFKSEVSARCTFGDIERICALNENPPVSDRLYCLLNMFWASDWITGAARPPQGIRSNFYSRVTPARLLLCLKTVYKQEDAQAHEIARLICDDSGMLF